MAVFQGLRIGAEKRRFAVVVARFNSFITKELLSGAQDALHQHGVPAEHVDVVWVPGAFELPHAALQCARSGRYHAVICLGALVRGDTPHFDYIASATTSSIQDVSLTTGIPCAFGLLTCNTVAQAIDRAGTKAGNKGADAALAALEMADLTARLPSSAGAAKS